MAEENNIYEKVIDILRKSKPKLHQLEKVENTVVSRIGPSKLKIHSISDFIESLFGWVYIGWVRKSFLTAAIALAVIFIYQQAFILKQVNNISKQIITIRNESIPPSSKEIGKQLTLFKISTMLSPKSEIKISLTQLEEILKSYDDLQLKYQDLLRAIEEDPELKSKIEEKLNEEIKYKPDI